jgi:hypothetical protein
VKLCDKGGRGILNVTPCDKDGRGKKIMKFVDVIYGWPSSALK